AAGVLGPVLVNYIRQYQLDHGVARQEAYNITMYILAGLLAVGFICNWLIKPVDPKYHMTPEQLAETAPAEAAPRVSDAAATAPAGSGVLVPLAWAAVWIPILWGVWVTLEKAVILFR